jgi:2-succinyl-6-hydroxy-2,4-cyclohexadiene-1-carboxylate synthase
VRGDGPALVLVHGFTGSTRTWEPFTDALARRWRVVAVDLPGHGRSPVPSRPEDARLPRVADALVAVLDRLGLERADWLGYSLGGRAALHVALAHPARVGRLVLESASPGIADPAARAALAADDEALAASLERDGLAAFVDRWTAQPLFASQARLPADVRARERAGRLAQSAAGLAAALRAMGVGTQEPLLERLPALRAPTLLVAGAEDRAYCEHAAAMAARLPDARTAVVPGAGHTVHLESPAAFWAAVGAFLAGASAGGETS